MNQSGIPGEGGPTSATVGRVIEMRGSMPYASDEKGKSPTSLPEILFIKLLVGLADRDTAPQPGISELESVPEIKQSWFRWSVPLRPLRFQTTESVFANTSPGSHAEELDLYHRKLSCSCDAS